MRDAGLNAEINGVGNVVGRSPGVSRCLPIGSYIGTQQTRGWLDGALGVMYGMEVARTLAEAAKFLSQDDQSVNMDL